MKCVSVAVIMLLAVAQGFGQLHPSNAAPGALRVGPGDLLHVQVFDTPELEEKARVSDNGELSLVLGGKVKVAGLTPAAAADAIEAVLRGGEYLKTPHVIVTVEQYATQTVSVLGQVRSPGAYPIETGRTIIDVLAMAGGLSETADRHITIERHESHETVKYFFSNDSSRSLGDAVMIYPGDRVIVPKAPMVYVLGDVGRPGGYPWTTNDSAITVLEAVSLAGGTTPSAKASHTQLIRQLKDGSHVEMQIALNRMERGKLADMALQPNDILYVPFSYMKNVAVGVGGIVAAASSAAIYVH